MYDKELENQIRSHEMALFNMDDTHEEDEITTMNTLEVIRDTIKGIEPLNPIEVIIVSPRNMVMAENITRAAGLGHEIRIFDSDDIEDDYFLFGSWNQLADNPVNSCFLLKKHREAMMRIMRICYDRMELPHGIITGGIDRYLIEREKTAEQMLETRCLYDFHHVVDWNNGLDMRKPTLMSKLWKSLSTRFQKSR